MHEIVAIFLLLAAVYLLLGALLYLFQRRLIYYPMPVDPDFNAQPVCIDNRGTRLRGWVLHPDRPRAVIYFGGNSELISNRAALFDDLFRDDSVYLINYRGYGDSDGKPSEAGLCADALAIYDEISPRHDRIIAYGRSLGSGVAVYLAAQRALHQLVLVTPYDSIAAVAQKAYPLFPVRWLIRDRFDSAALAGKIDIPVLIVSAEHDRVVRLEHTLELKRRFARAAVSYAMIEGAAHNDVTEFADYRRVLTEFLAD